MEVKPIRDTVKEIEGELVIRITKSWSEVFDIKAGDMVEFSPVKVNSQLSTVPKIPIVDAECVQTTKSEDVREDFLQKIRAMKLGIKRLGKGRTEIYDIGATCRIYLKVSTRTMPYFFGLGPEIIAKFNDATRQLYIVLLAGNENQAYIMPWVAMNECLRDIAPAVSDGEWKLNITKDRMLCLTGKPSINISKYLNKLHVFN